MASKKKQSNKFSQMSTLQSCDQKEYKEKIPEEKGYQMYIDEVVGRQMLPEIMTELPEQNLRLFGYRLPRCDQYLMKAMEAGKNLKTLKIGSIFCANKRQFRVEKILGHRSYRISDCSSQIKYYLKLEAIAIPDWGPNLKRDVILLNSAFQSPPFQRRHFLSIFDRGCIPNTFNFIILQYGDSNLADVRAERLGGADFSKPTAHRIACQTLQAIHDVHLHHYFHRDIRASNFVIGLNDNHDTIYIINFSLSYEYVARNARRAKGIKLKEDEDETPPITPKLPWISCRFQSRSFHLAYPIRRMDDLESWIYLLVDIFDQNALPWKNAKNERNGFNQKERFFMGDYGDRLGDLKPYVDLMRKHCESCKIKSTKIVDFPFYGDILKQMAKDWKITGKEPLDWMPDPCGYRNMARSGDAKPAKNNSKQPVESPPPAPAAEDDFNLLPVTPIEGIPKESPKGKPEKKVKEKKQSPSGKSPKTAKTAVDEKKNANKKEINAIRKSSKVQHGTRKGGAKKSVEETESKNVKDEKCDQKNTTPPKDDDEDNASVDVTNDSSNDL